MVIDNKTYTVIETRLNPCYNLNSEEPVSADMAILVLDRDIDAQTGYVDVYNADPDTGYGSEIGKKFTLMGWGGYGPMGEEPSRAGEFHAGENVWERIESGMLVYSMDSQANGGLELEALAWDGDSGGPALIEVSPGVQ